MTLTQTIVAPWGVWQSVDFRLTYKRKPLPDWSHKTVLIRCPDGGALLRYTGLGRFARNSADISVWIARQWALVLGEVEMRLKSLIRTLFYILLETKFPGSRCDHLRPRRAFF